MLAHHSWYYCEVQLSSNDDTSDDEDEISSDDSSDVIAPQPSSLGTSVGVLAVVVVLSALVVGVFYRSWRRSKYTGRLLCWWQAWSCSPTCHPPSWMEEDDGCSPANCQLVY